MTTVSGTFTATGQSSHLQLKLAEENVTVNLSGTYAAVVQLEREKSPGAGAWEVVMGPWRTANATVAEVYRVDRQNETLRLNCTSYTSGTVTYSFLDSAKVLEVVKDSHGTELYRVTEDGMTLAGNVSVAGTLGVTGATTLSGTLGVTGLATLSAGAETAATEGHPEMLEEVASATNPVWSFNSDNDTGVGRAAANQPSMVAGGTEIQRYTSGGVQSTVNAGTAGTGVTAVEYGDGKYHTSILTLAGVAATIGDNAALAGGALIYTFPAGAIAVHAATMSVGLTLTTGTPTTDTPELGLGTTQGSGVNATLGDVGAGAENILGPAVADDIAGTAELLTAISGLAIEAAGAHTVYFNYADTWADVDDTAATLDGTVTLVWSLLA